MLLGNFSLGFWRLADAKLTSSETLSLVQKALDLGVKTMDHADIYGEYRCEKLFGEALKGQNSLRDKMQLVSKCGIKFNCEATPNNLVKHYDLSAKSIRNSVENSLTNLNTDYLDLLLVHRPSPIMDVQEIADTFYRLKKEGKVLNFGVSNFTTSQFELLNRYVNLQTNQIEISLLNLNSLYDGTLDQTQKHGIRPMAWSPLAGGKIFKPETEQQKKLHDEMHSLLTKYNAKSIDQIAMAWLLKHPANIQIILGTQNISRLQTAVESSKIDLDVQDWFKLLEISQGYAVP